MVAINQKKLNQFLASDRVSFKGVEKENLRSDKDGRISNKSFPEASGKLLFEILPSLSDLRFSFSTPLKETRSEAKN